MFVLHWRLVMAACLGFVGLALATAINVPSPARALLGWNIGAISYAGLMWTLFVSAPESAVKERAGRQDEGRGMLTVLVLAAILASLAAIIVSLMSVKGQSDAAKNLVTGLSALTLLTSWVVLQSIFVVHYGHRHFQDIEEYGTDAGFMFPGQEPKTYMDFAYLAVCVGATAQISDPSIPTTRLRNLVTAHAVISFFYNTAVLAVGINILSGLIGH